MLEDVQLMMAARMFDGPLEWSKEKVGGDPAPCGMYETRCRVPREQGMCALVSRLWQEKFREWREQEIEKCFDRMCFGLLRRVCDLCDREQYSWRNAYVPSVSTLEGVFFVQGVKVVTLRFERTGEKDRHELSTWVSTELKVSVRMVETPRCGWKSMRSMLDGELDEWIAWADAEFKAQHVWIRGCL